MIGPGKDIAGPGAATTVFPGLTLHETHRAEPQLRTTWES